jgi:hypothetical protein
MSAYLWSLLALALGLAYLLGLLTTGLFGRREQEEFVTVRCRECGKVLMIKSDSVVQNEWAGPCEECKGTGTVES